MNLRDIFLGPVRFWLLWVVVVAVLGIAGRMQLHVFDFRMFLLVLIGLAAGSVAVIVLTRRPGERVTREPLDED